MKVEHRIDSISITLPHTPSPLKLLHPLLQTKTDTLEDTTPQRGYSGAWRLNPSGVRVNWHDTRRDMGTHLQYGGKALLWCASKGFSPYDIMRHDIQYGGKVSRLDLAIDLHDSGVRWDDIQNAMKDIVTRTKVANEVKNALGRGWTQYIGSRSSDAMVRIYDKSAESGMSEDVDYVRIELELKGRRAKLIATKIYETMREGRDVAPIIRGEICRVCDFPKWKVWKEAMSGEIAEAQKLGKRQTDTVKWLLETVAPTLAREKLRDEQTYVDFIERVDIQINILTSDDT